jgi:cytochrome c-type biogenesis protein
MRTIVVLIALLTTLSSAADAATHARYTQAGFAEAQAQGRRILVHVDASWCATCSVQESTLAGLEKNPALSDLLVFTIDFDLNKAAVERFKVAAQSTLILFYGRTEIARLTGATDPQAIKAFLDGAPSRFAQVKELSAAGYFLALLAGILSILSPCVLPLLPIVLAAAATSHRFGPVALGAGLLLFLVATGLFVDMIGFGIGVGSNTFRLMGATIMAVFGVVLLSRLLQDRMARWAVPLQAAGDRLMVHVAPLGLAGQFLVGALLGMVWGPCVGPTLGAAIALAAQRKDIEQVALTMFFFGLGTALPLVLIGAISRETLIRWRARINAAGHVGHALLGSLLLVMGAMIFSGLDRYVETKLLQVTPAWLHVLTTRF